MAQKAGPEAASAKCGRWGFEADGAVEDTHRQLAHAVQLAGPAGQDKARARLEADARIFQSITEQFGVFLRRAER